MVWSDALVILCPLRSRITLTPSGTTASAVISAPKVTVAPLIGNHGYSHNYSAIYSSPQAVLDEYNHTNSLIQQALGDSNFNSHLFRFPGGLAGGKYADIKNQARDLLEQNEIFQVNWNALTGDSEKAKPTPEELMTNLQKTTEGKNSVVILMHDSAAKKVTADILPQVIEYLKSQGYEMKTFYDIMEI